MNIEKYVMRCEKITKRSLDKVSVSSYNNKNGVVLEQPRLRFLTIRVGEVGTILAQSEAFETKYTEFFYKAMQ